jgi:hypothetical protein
MSNLLAADRSKPRWRLDCPAQDVGVWIDHLCDGLKRAGIDYAYLSPQRGSLLSNITVRENLWLPLAWRRPFPPQRLDQGLRDLIANLSGVGALTALDCDSFLKAYPDNLPIHQYCLAILLRAALLRPRWLVIDAGWFFPPIPGEWCTPPALMDALFASAAWLTVAPHATTLAGPWNWTMVNCDDPRLLSWDEW